MGASCRLARRRRARSCARLRLTYSASRAYARGRGPRQTRERGTQYRRASLPSVVKQTPCSAWSGSKASGTALGDRAPAPAPTPRRIDRRSFMASRVLDARSAKDRADSGVYLNAVTSKNNRQGCGRRKAITGTCNNTFIVMNLLFLLPL
eukprot:scaffold127213_cov75-Phaeocystis_antarctica.AAC.1